MRWSATEALVKALEAYRARHDWYHSECVGELRICICDLCLAAEAALAEIRNA